MLLIELLVLAILVAGVLARTAVESGTGALPTTANSILQVDVYYCISRVLNESQMTHKCSEKFDFQKRKKQGIKLVFDRRKRCF